MIEHMITSSVLIVSVLIASVLLENKISPILKYTLWLLVVVKLLIPLPDFETRLSVMNLVPMEKIQEKWETSGIKGGKADEIAADDINGKRIAEDINGKDTEFSTKQDIKTFIEDRKIPLVGMPEGEASVRNQEISHLIEAIWAAGVLFFISLFAFTNLHFYLKIRKTRTCVGYYQGLKIYQVDRKISPCLYGLLSLAIYVGKEIPLEEDKKQYIMAHEYTHYSHRDYIWAVIRCLCIILYWYHPLVWIAAHASIKDGELACDAGTIKLIGEEKRIEYGKTLIEVLQLMGSGHRGNAIFTCSIGMEGGSRDMKKRMKLIAKKPRTSKLMVSMLALSCALLAGCTFGSAEGRKEDGVRVSPEIEMVNETSVSDELSKDELNEELISTTVEKTAKGADITLNVELLEGTDGFLSSDWAMPTESPVVSGWFGEQENGTASDHINLIQKEGASVFAVEDGIVEEVGFDSTEGNYILLDLGNETKVKYGHLQEIIVEEAREIKKGEKIGTVGKTGMATGANLSLTLYVNGEEVNPLKE